ncbi:tetratricopeptide repeat protein [Patescibacteria group bacterium]|nr:tetratricopeptide repeat protein [Patescibacteria group bacterium]
MALSKLKASAQIQAVRKFTNRDQAKNAYREVLTDYLERHFNLKVLSFYGVGGIGKTKLLKHLKSQTEKFNDVILASIDLESSHYTSQMDFLLDLRRQLQLKSPLFDYAIARFFTISGRSLKELKKSWLSKDSLLFDLQEVAANLAEIIAPARLVKKLLDISDAKMRRYLGKHKKDFDAIDGMSESDLSHHLPFYLGSAISNAATKNNKKFVIFIDTIETLRKRRFFRLTKEYPDEWLMELIGSSETGLWIVASREYIKWADINSEWNRYLEQHSLGALTESDSDYFLRHIPINEERVREAIIESAKGVPLYLDLCANTYLIRKNEGKTINESDFRLHENEVITRFLAHLDPEHQETIRAISVIPAFDFRLFSSIVTSLNINFPLTLYDEFCSTAYTESIGDDEGRFRIHSVIRAFLHDEADNITVQLIQECLTNEINYSKENIDYRRLLWLIEQFFAVVSKYGVLVQKSQASVILAAGLDVVNRGYWREIGVVLGKLHFVRHINTEAVWGVSIKYLKALIYRKQGRLIEADKVYQEAILHKDILGEFGSLLEFHAAHTAHLLGKYTIAEKIYEKLARTNVSKISPNQSALLAERQNGDIKMLKGRFKDALNTFDKLLETCTEYPLWDAECHRFRGHVFRFNYDFEKAINCYKEAEKLSREKKADVMLGKVLTNFAETWCWKNPSDAVVIGKEAVSLNKQVGSPIEVGKAYTAIGIAHAFLGEFGPAYKAANNAVTIQKNTGYRSGELFGLNSKAIIHMLEGNNSSLKKVMAEMGVIINKIGVYKYLTYHLHLVLADNYKFPWDIDWLSKEKTIKTIKDIFKIKAID